MGKVGTDEERDEEIGGSESSVGTSNSFQERP